MRAWLGAVVLVMCAAPLIPPAHAALVTPCTGDCDADWRVEISDLIVGVKVALGTADSAACASVACGRQGSAPVTCLIAAVNNAMRATCESPPVNGYRFCGYKVCGPGLVCCNPLMSICTPPGVYCIQ